MKNADLVYLVDEQYRLLSFNPRDGKNELKLLGDISCPAGRSFDGGTATPVFDVRRSRCPRLGAGNSGEIFWVNTKDLSCKTVALSPAAALKHSDGLCHRRTWHRSRDPVWRPAVPHLDPGRTDGQHRQKVAHADSGGSPPTTEYGPELTGTGRGELWAYFPESVSRLSR